MGAPYVSLKRLTDNSLAAMLSAVEVYNKPQMTYRDEVTVMLVVNAWELALKATLRQKNRSIFYPKRRGERYRSIAIDDALGRVNASNLWPTGIRSHPLLLPTSSVLATQRRLPGREPVGERRLEVALLPQCQVAHVLEAGGPRWPAPVPPALHL